MVEDSNCFGTVSKSGAARRVGSSPTRGTKLP